MNDFIYYIIGVNHISLFLIIICVPKYISSKLIVVIFLHNTVIWLVVDFGRLGVAPFILGIVKFILHSCSLQEIYTAGTKRWSNVAVMSGQHYGNIASICFVGIYSS